MHSMLHVTTEEKMTLNNIDLSKSIHFEAGVKWGK